MNNQGGSNSSPNPSRTPKQAGDGKGPSKEREQQGAPNQEKEVPSQDKPSRGQEGASER